MRSSRPISEACCPLSDVLRIGVIGFGNHVVKNILRCFQGNKAREIARVYVRRTDHYRSAHPDLGDRFTDSLDAVLGDPAIDVVYIATPISTHFQYADAALRAGKHVWCEKPVTGDLETTRRLVALAADRGLFLGEVAMYQHHAQFAATRRLISAKAEVGERLIDARARFSIPELARDDIRYSKALGGGALLDVGYYPLSAAAVLFGEPDNLLATGHVSEDLGVDLSGSALLVYGDFACHTMWAIGSSYINEMELSFTRSTYRFERAFSKPADLETRIRVINAFGQEEDTIVIPPDDQFENMFSAFSAAVHSGDPENYCQLGHRSLITASLLQMVHDKVYGAAPTL